MTDGGNATGDTDRPEGKVKTLPTGDEVHEADDCRFVSSSSGTVHERDEWPGDAHEYDYHPRCGQRLPAGSMWSHVDAETVEEAVLKYDLTPCSKCIGQSYRLEGFRSAIHGSLAYSSPEDVPDDVLRRADLEQYIDTDTDSDGGDDGR